MHYTRLTLFHVLWFTAVVFGVTLGIKLGLRYFGTVGVVSCGVGGFLVGHILGCVPEWAATKMLHRDLERSTNEELRAIVAADDWMFCHTMALLHLAARGEEVRSELPRILLMLESESQLTRLFGWDALRIVFPQETGIIGDYNPEGPAEECRDRVAMLGATMVEPLGQTPAS